MKKHFSIFIAFLIGISLLLVSTQVKADVYASKSETTVVFWLLRGGNLAAPVTQAVTNTVGYYYNQTSSTQRYVTKLDLCIIAHNGRDFILSYFLSASPWAY